MTSWSIHLLVVTAVLYLMAAGGSWLYGKLAYRRLTRPPRLRLTKLAQFLGLLLLGLAALCQAGQDLANAADLSVMGLFMLMGGALGDFVEYLRQSAGR